MHLPFHRWERRHLPRFSVEELVSLSFESSQLTGTCKDVSTEGMYCLVKLKIARGSKVQFLLNLPSEAMLIQPVRLQGTGHVVRVHHDAADANYGVGICFDS